MGRRKKQDTVSQEMANPEAQIANEPPEIYMDKVDMLQLSLKEAQAGLLREQMEKFRYQENLMLMEQKIALSNLRSRRRDIETQYKVYTEEYNALLAKIQSKLGVNLKEYGVSEEGKLTFIPMANTNENVET